MSVNVLRQTPLLSSAGSVEPVLPPRQIEVGLWGSGIAILMIKQKVARLDSLNDGIDSDLSQGSA